MKHILFLTTANLATNPRLYKELQLALKAGHICTLIHFKLGNWSDEKSCELLAINNEFNKTHNISLDATHKSKLNWLKWGLLEKIASKLYKLLNLSLIINVLAHSRRSFQILKAAKKLKNKPNLICAHNLGALYPAWKLSEKWNIPFIFDVEDYHPGEIIHFDAKNEKLRRAFLMKKLLPEAAAITFASPLIEEYTLKLIGDHPNHLVILNSFPSSEFKEPLNANALSPHQPNNLMTSPNSQLKLVWFSQKISFGRGLEQLFEALSLLTTNNSLLITLIGDMDPEFEKQIIQPFLKSLNTLYPTSYNPTPNDLTTYQSNDLKHSSFTTHYSLLIKPPLSQPELHAELANHDIGLAMEFSNRDLNRQLCLTNKILAYTQAGLYTLATDTPAQKHFMEQYPNHGSLCKQTSSGILEGITQLIKNKELIKNKKIERFKNAKVLCWETEEGKIREMVEGAVVSGEE